MKSNKEEAFKIAYEIFESQIRTENGQINDMTKHLLMYLVHLTGFEKKKHSSMPVYRQLYEELDRIRVRGILYWRIERMINNDRWQEIIEYCSLDSDSQSVNNELAEYRKDGGSFRIIKVWKKF